MLVHLHVVIMQLSSHGKIKMYRHDGVTPRVPIYVRYSIFNDIPPIQGWWVLNDDHSCNTPLIEGHISILRGICPGLSQDNYHEGIGM
jgi:hypothetical protein